jgi:hypothetical protein
LIAAPAFSHARFFYSHDDNKLKSSYTPVIQGLQYQAFEG